jgi:hypothetical protein
MWELLKKSAQGSEDEKRVTEEIADWCQKNLAKAIAEKDLNLIQRVYLFSRPDLEDEVAKTLVRLL